MALVEARSPAEVLDALGDEGRPVIVGFFGSFSESARRARLELEQACASHDDRAAFAVDVGQVRELHGLFGVDAVPTVLVLAGSRVLQKLSGVQTRRYYDRALFGGAAAAVEGAAKPAHRVTVYTSDTCPWCTRTKSYLDQHHVGYREVNVSRDEDAARRLVASSGRQGVPQLRIDGQWVIGFDKPRIDSLLGLAAGAPA